MKKNKFLLKFYNKLKKHYLMSWKSPEAISVSFSQDEENHDLIVSYEPSMPDVVIVSVNVQCTNAPAIANFMLSAMYASNVGLGTPYYLNSQNQLFLGEEAFSQHQMDLQNMLQTQQSLGKVVYH